MRTSASIFRQGRSIWIGRRRCNMCVRATRISWATLGVRRQQSVLPALKKKLDNATALSKLSDLAADLQGSVLTSLTLGQIVSLANFAKKLQPTDFQQYVLGVPIYGSYGMVNGKSAVRPNWAAINKVLGQIFPEDS